MLQRFLPSDVVWLLFLDFRTNGAMICVHRPCPLALGVWPCVVLGGKPVFVDLTRIGLVTCQRQFGFLASWNGSLSTCLWYRQHEHILMEPGPFAYDHGTDATGICSWYRYHGHILMQLLPGANDRKNRSGDSIRTSGLDQTKSKSANKNESERIWHSRAENSSKSISKQFPIGSQPSPTAKSN